MPELLTDEEIEAITRLAYGGGKGDPQRDVRRLLMHIDILDKGHRFFLARRDVLQSGYGHPYYREKVAHETDAFKVACEAHDAGEKAAEQRRLAT
jgi:hypothetical protein